MEEQFGGFIVKLFKDRFSEEELQKMGLNERQIDAILYYKSKGEITSSEYAERYKVTDRTARNDLNELVENKLFIKKGETNLAKYVYDFQCCISK